MDRKRSRFSGIDVRKRISRHGSIPQADTSPSSPAPVHSTPDQASPQYLTSSTAPRRVSPLADLGTLISKSQLNRRISQQPSPPPHHQSSQSIGPDGQSTGLSADQSNSRRATADPSFLSKFIPPQSYGERNSISNILDLYSTPTTSTTIPAPTSTISPTPIQKPTNASTPTPNPLHQLLPPAEPNMFLPPLTLIHFHCYQSHRNMKRSNNIYAPVPCMTCRIDDTEMRWKCTWCCLRICAACMQKLENVRGKDLTTLIQRLGRGRRRSQGV